jgi:IS5 family transposase
MTHFRKRLKHADLAALQDELLQKEQKQKQTMNTKNDDDNDEPTGSANQGRLIVDATCATADIAYPTDLGLLNDAREKSEILIDKLYAHAPVGIKKPRTYRQKARGDFLGLSMKRNMTKRSVQRGLRKQLQCLSRNLKSIGELVELVSLKVLEPRWYRTFW